MICAHASIPYALQNPPIKYELFQDANTAKYVLLLCMPLLTMLWFWWWVFSTFLIIRKSKLGLVNVGSVYIIIIILVNIQLSITKCVWILLAHLIY